MNVGGLKRVTTGWIEIENTSWWQMVLCEVNTCESRHSQRTYQIFCFFCDMSNNNNYNNNQQNTKVRGKKSKHKHDNILMTKLTRTVDVRVHISGTCCNVRRDMWGILVVASHFRAKWRIHKKNYTHTYTLKDRKKSVVVAKAR